MIAIVNAVQLSGRRGSGANIAPATGTIVRIAIATTTQSTITAGTP